MPLDQVPPCPVLFSYSNSSNSSSVLRTRAARGLSTLLPALVDRFRGTVRPLPPVESAVESATPVGVGLEWLSIVGAGLRSLGVLDSFDLCAFCEDG
jgi:hypothetical protein